MNLSIVIAGWMIAITLGYFALRQSWRAHWFIDHGLMYAARVRMLWTTGTNLFLWGTAVVMISVRHLMTSLITPILICGIVPLLTFWLVIRAGQRIRQE